MDAADLVAALPFAAYAVSGLLVVLVQPRNRSAQLIAAVGLLLPLSRGLEEVDDGTWGALGNTALVPWARDATFLLGLACLVAALTRFPDGRHETRTERWAERGIGTAALLATAGLLADGRVATVARAVADTEPLWALAAVALLVLRYRRAGSERRLQVRWPLQALSVLAVVLAVALLAPGDPDWTGPVFLAALALFPASLAVGVAARARQTETDLLLSRARLVTAEDQARRRIERDLHDGAQQQLVGLLSLVQLAQRQHERGEASTADTLVAAARETQRTMTDLRELASGIHPSVLSDCGLADAVDSRLSLLPHDAALRNRLGAARWPPATEAAAYFLVCEALTNASKHAACERIVVELGHEAGRFQVAVIDDGQGFDPSVTTSRGLQGLRDRVEALGGTVDVSSAPGKGTSVRASFPGQGG